MPRRGLSEIDEVVYGGVHLTAQKGALPAGDPEGRPLNGAWVTADKVDPDPGVSDRAADGSVSTRFYPTAGEEHELVFTRMDPSVAAALRAGPLTTGTNKALRIPLADGRTFVGQAKPNRLAGRHPLEEGTGDHPHYGGQLADVHLFLIVTSGGFE